MHQQIQRYAFAFDFCRANHQIRDIQSRGQPRSAAGEAFTDRNLCVTEILDARTQKMIQSSALLLDASDYMQTNEMASKVLAQVRYVWSKGHANFSGSF